MEVDFRSLNLGKMDLGSPNQTYDWNFVKETSGITMLSSPHPADGSLCFKIVKQYTSASEMALFPTSTHKASDGNTSVERNAANAYAQFTIMVAAGVGSSTNEGLIPSLATSYDDLDEKLVSLSKLNKKLIKEFQRTGINQFGAQKATLDLRYPPGFTWNDESHLKHAAIRYESYTKELRINALKDIRESILVEYFEPSVMSQIIKANRILRIEFQKSEYEGSLNNFSSNEQSPLLPDSTYASISVKFIDQQGDEVIDIPYTVSVRGAINFRDSWIKTNGGKNPGLFASGSTLFQSSNESEGGRHYLYRYKINDEVPHRGSFKVQVIIPEYDRNSPWANSRLKVYAGVPSSADDREGSIVATKPGAMITSQAFTFRGKGSYKEIRVPVYREPLPTHLVEGEDGKLISKWSTITNVNKLPDHQKVKVMMKISRLTQSQLWENADLNADGIIDQSEYQSPQGELARDDINLESKLPVRGVKVELRPSNENTWLTSRNTFSSTTDLSGVVSITLPVGEYSAFIVSQNDTGEITENQIGVIEVPAGVFYRNTTQNDTTPISVIGAILTKSYMTVGDFKLNSSIPRLPEGKAPNETVYAISSLTGIESGWPNSSGTSTSERIFDAFEIILSSLPGEIVLSPNLEDVEEETEAEPSLEFGQTIEMTQASTGSVVIGIDATAAGTKWKVTRLAVSKNQSPTVTFSDQYNPNTPTDQHGENNYSIANITFPRATSMEQGDDMLVFYPDIPGSIVAYPTESVTMGTPGDGKNYTFSIESEYGVEPTVNETTQNNANNGTIETIEVSNALPVPVIAQTPNQNNIIAQTPNQNNIGDGLPSVIVQNTAVTPAVSTVTQDYLNSQSIVNSYGAGNLTYSNAAYRLETEHSWSSTDISNMLDPLYNQHQAALNSAAQAQNNAAYWEHIIQQQTSDNSSSLPAAVQNALNRLAQANAQAQANAAAAQAQANAESVQRAAQAQANAQANAQEQANALEAVSAMNTDGDGYITWRNGLSNNEIATREAAIAAAVNAQAAEAATPEAQAALAAEHAKIAAAIASGGITRL